MYFLVATDPMLRRAWEVLVGTVCLGCVYEKSNALALESSGFIEIPNHPAIDLVPPPRPSLSIEVAIGRDRVKRTRERQFLGMFVVFIRNINGPWHGFRFDQFGCISSELIRGHVFGGNWTCGKGKRFLHILVYW